MKLQLGKKPKKLSAIVLPSFSENSCNYMSSEAVWIISLYLYQTPQPKLQQNFQNKIIQLGFL